MLSAIERRDESRRQHENVPDANIELMKKFGDHGEAWHEGQGVGTARCCGAVNVPAARQIVRRRGRRPAAGRPG
jgi:hypothetical protein